MRMWALRCQVHLISLQTYISSIHNCVKFLIFYTFFDFHFSVFEGFQMFYLLSTEKVQQYLNVDS